MTAVECGLGSGKWEVGTWGLADWDWECGEEDSVPHLENCCSAAACCYASGRGRRSPVARRRPLAAVARVWSRVSMGVGEWRATVLPACVAWPLLAFIFHVTVSD
jgi:hypothetical protein